jgi:peroxiredoxin
MILSIYPDDDVKFLDFIGLREKSENSNGLEIGLSAPEFSLYSLDGDQINLIDNRETPVMINFWATWCAPCVIEMPLIQKRFDQYEPDLVVLAVNAGESKSAVDKFIRENKLNFLTLLDPTRLVHKLYQIRAYPTTYFIDRKGVIQAIHIGVLSEDQLDSYLSEIGAIDG